MNQKRPALDALRARLAQWRVLKLICSQAIRTLSTTGLQLEQCREGAPLF